MDNFRHVLAHLKSLSRTPREQGTYFEQLMVRLLPLLPDRDFQEVWTWQDWPDRKRFSGMDGIDLGIDLVGQRDDGSYCAIQCKFYDENTTIQKGDINSFFAELGKDPFESGLIITTTDKWSANAEKTLKGQTKDVQRMRFADLAGLTIEWDVLRPDRTRLKPDKKKLFPRQKEALEAVTKGFETHQRGKLIMACGTGKTLLSLHIAEKLVPSGGNILFLVPSISLLSQSLHEWSYQQSEEMRYLAVCSDAQVDKDKEDIAVADLAMPATTDATRINAGMSHQANSTTVVFCTYHSLDRIKQAQNRGAPDFDLVICDEAHRTTGVEWTDRDGKTSHFSKILKPDYVKAKKRLFMTATPRLYSESSKEKAAAMGIATFSMDDEVNYGPEFYRLNFSTAVREDMLADYKVIVLSVGQDYAAREMATMLEKDTKLKIDDVAKIIGCYKALRDRGQDPNKKGERGHMRRAVGFANIIKTSEYLTNRFQKIVDTQDEAENDGFTCKTQHVDGKMSALERTQKLDWLRQDPGSNEHGEICNILFNARCLTEGVDIPALDAVMFMQPRASEVDIVQAVGRVMRRAEDKDYGYIIVPVMVDGYADPAEAMKQKNYATVWKVLNALRAHDDRFQAMINKLELNDNKPPQVEHIGIGLHESDQQGLGESSQQGLDHDVETALDEMNGQLSLDLWENAIFAKIVEKCGERQYWENWARDVAEIHGKITDRIDALRKVNGQVEETYDDFYKGIQNNINEALTQEDATSMLAQHMITEPVFDALFEGYAFSRANPVSQNMTAVIDRLKGAGLETELDNLGGFYNSVRDRAAGIDNKIGRQKVIIELYEKFFKTAFPKVSESLGIAYTPIEIVDFVLASADHALNQEFGCGLSDEDVHVIDPFTGTGSFINRLIQSDLIKDKDLPRKFTHELHANEILLLAYYIASVNIEEAYHARTGASDYETFPGIVLTDTFNLFEKAGEDEGSLEEHMFPENNARVRRQKKAPIRVVVGNPPWSAGQKSENDAAKNMEYPELDKSIRLSYAAKSKTTLKSALYDSYIRAFCWASDRIREKGVIAFVSNGGWLDGTSTDGFRQVLAEEFDAIWVFNARGNARLSGEPRRKEKDNVFGQSCRTPVTFTILVKNPKNKRTIADIHYHDIGDYLSRQDKLNIITTAGHIGNLDWQSITPNKDNDWINQRDPMFQTFKALGSEEVKAGRMAQPDTIFRSYCSGVKTNRDVWAYNFSQEKLGANMKAMIDFYNEQCEGFAAAQPTPPPPHTHTHNLDVEDFVNNDPTKIKWDGTLKDDLSKFRKGKYSSENRRYALYRAYVPQWFYFDRQFNNSVYRQPSYFPNGDSENRVIIVSGPGAGTGFSPLITNKIPNLHSLDTGQCFPRYVYNAEGEREDNITEACVREFNDLLGDGAAIADDIFNYVYGVLHEPGYQKRFAHDLKKELPRIPMPDTAQTFHHFRDAGAALAELHLNFETGPEYELDILVNGNPILPDVLEEVDYKVSKMRWAGHNGEDETAIIYNNQITLAGIPEAALCYKVSGRSALHWLIDRYQIKTDRPSGIVNDPNDWVAEQGDPQWLIRHIKRITYLSVESARIISELPSAFGNPGAWIKHHDEQGSRHGKVKFSRLNFSTEFRHMDPNDQNSFYFEVDFTYPNLNTEAFSLEKIAELVTEQIAKKMREPRFFSDDTEDEQRGLFAISDMSILYVEGSCKGRIKGVCNGLDPSEKFLNYSRGVLALTLAALLWSKQGLTFEEWLYPIIEFALAEAGIPAVERDDLETGSDGLIIEIPEISISNPIAYQDAEAMLDGLETLQLGQTETNRKAILYRLERDKSTDTFKIIKL